MNEAINFNFEVGRVTCIIFLVQLTHSLLIWPGSKINVTHGDVEGCEVCVGMYSFSRECGSEA